MKTVLSLLLLALLAGCTSLLGMQQKPEVTLAGLELRDASLFEQRWALRLRVQNPNDVDLPVDGLSFDIELNGRPFAHGVADRAVSIPRFGEGIVDVTATSTLGAFVRQFRELQKGTGGRLGYRVSGTLHSGRFGNIPFERSGELDLSSPELPLPGGERT